MTNRDKPTLRAEIDAKFEEIIQEALVVVFGGGPLKTDEENKKIVDEADVKARKIFTDFIAQVEAKAVERERKKINSLIRKKFEYLEERSQELWRLIKNGVEYHRADKNANDVAIMRLREVWREIEALQKEEL